jgi:hypothetical protein
MNLKKMISKVNLSQVLMIVAAVALVYAFYNYSNGKGTILDAMRPMSPGEVNGVAPSAEKEESGPAPASGLVTSQPGQSMKASMQDPSELLPKDSNSEFAKSNPSGMGHLKGVSLLTPQEQIGINSVGQCNRNPNLQLRTDPNIPKRETGPWNQSTIEQCGNNGAKVLSA